MANSALFGSTPGLQMAAADTTNAAGGKAYAMTPEHALTQYALTGTFNDTFYASASAQLTEVLKLCGQVSPEYIAKLAIYARQNGYMKDMPAFLLAYLSNTDYKGLEHVFSQVVTNGKMLRNYVQMIRSGVTGRKSLGSRLRRLVRDWLAKADERALLSAKIGNDPSLADVIKMVHPKPAEAWRAAMFSWIIGKDANAEALPKVCFDYDTFVAAAGNEGFGELELPAVPFLMLTSLPLSLGQWKKLVHQMSWTQLRMNLNTLQRNKVFEDAEVTAYVANRLRDADEVRKARVFPYQLLTTYQTVKATGELPRSLIDALHDALEVALENVPTIEGKVAVLTDVSGSMSSNKVTGSRPGATTVTRCVDVAGLIAAALLRRNPDTKVIGFDDKAYDLNSALEPRDTVMTNASKIASINGGSTDCAIGIHAMFDNNIEADLVIMISDNESWVENTWGFRSHMAGQATGLTNAWTRYKTKYPKAKMICLDIVPNSSTQAKDRVDTLNIGGFSDNVFTLIAAYAKGEIGAQFWVGEVKKVELPA